MKQPLLYLCHRIPYPPNKGDKIRSFNQLAYLSEHYDVYLGCFIDDPADVPYTKNLSPYVKGMLVLPLNKKTATLRSLTAIGTGKPMSLPYFYDLRMQSWVDNTVAKFQIQKALVFCSSMAQYLESPLYKDVHRVIDFVDLDSDKWRQYAEKKNYPMRWVYNREYKTLLAYEGATAQRYDASVFISPYEIKLFNELTEQQHSNKVKAIGNGVDLEFFAPLANNTDIETHEPTLVFTGAMDYWANVDAVRWFVKHVWPLITKQVRNPRFLIVGANPVDKVKELAAFKGIEVTGKVQDIRKYIQSGWVSIAPMRIARGIQNKVLEAMAMELPVVATTQAMEGLADTQGCNLIVTDNAQIFADAVVAYLHHRTRAPENRAWVEHHYLWQEQLSGLHQLLEQ